jgi:DNA-binding NarL/FixJ family response regulator
MMQVTRSLSLTVTITPGHEAILAHAREVRAASCVLEGRTQRAVAHSRAARAATGLRSSASLRPHLVLTPRQLEILRLIDAGHGTKQIARMLWLSPATVRNHVASIMAALGVHSRLQALARARELGLLAEAELDAAAIVV